MVVVLAECEALIAGIVVIGEGAMALDDFDVVDAGALHDCSGGLAACDGP